MGCSAWRRWEVMQRTDGNNGSPLGAVATRAELDASTGNKYFHDVAGGLLHLKAVTQTGRTQVTLFVVPRQAGCGPRLWAMGDRKSVV